MAGAAASKLAADQRIVARLNQAVADFISRLSQASMSQDSAQRLPYILRVARYYEAVAELAVETAAAARESPLPALIEAGGSFLDQTTRLISRIDPEGNLEQVADIQPGLQGLEGDYQILKAELLEAGAQGRLPVADMDARLRAASALRRALQQAVKAARMLTAKAMVSGVEQAARVQ
jgi:phosphate:Na+ symporter